MLMIPDVDKLLKIDFKSLARELFCNIVSYGDSSGSLSSSDLE